MGRRKVLQSSIYPDVTGNWWRADLTNGDIRWARQNLVADETGMCKLQLKPEFTQTRIKRIYGTKPSENWVHRVHFKEGDLHPSVLVQMGDQYRLRDLSALARLTRDPELAPHINFRKLVHGNTAVALGFLKEFGPLFLNDLSPRPLVWIDLNDLWRKHARFVAICRLYESLDDEELLFEAVLNIAEDIQALNAAGPADLGKILHTHKDSRFIRLVVIRSPRDYQIRDQNGDRIWSSHLLREHALELITSELTLHTGDGIGATWIRVEDEESFKVRPERVILSLWAGLWEMFGLDIWSGYSWRACRICGNYFYPLQKNSDCCKPEHQALWSKRVYARRARLAKKQLSGG